MQRLKISREGVILIKSFEGYRPRAVRREDGRWVVGYGHTLSAREGATVSEAEAELLLQYDLVPIAKALNAVPQRLNQNQFDALASFAFSVGLDRFQSSNVLERLVAGDAAQAAEAMAGWSDPLPVISPEHRRATERALFATPTAAEARVLAERAAAQTLTAPETPPSDTASFAQTAPVEALVSAGSGAASPQRYQAYGAGIVGPLPGPFPADLTPSNDAEAEPAPFPAVLSAETSVADGAPLQVQAPFDATAAVSTDRPVLNDGEGGEQAALFDDRGVLRPDARQRIRTEVAAEEPRRFDWRDITLYVVMSGFGLVTFGLAVAAFRTASQGAGRTDFMTIAWVLAVLGFASIAVSIWNLYRKLGRHEA